MFDFRFCLNYLAQITVEPILLLHSLATSISQVPGAGLYYVVCQQLFHDQPELDCRHMANTTIDGKPAEVMVQQRMTTWNMANSFAVIVPAICAELFLGAYSDRCGRKVNILLGIVGSVIPLYPQIILFTYPVTTPYYILVITSAVCAFTGSYASTIISSVAYMTDIEPVPSRLGMRIAILTTFTNIGNIVGPIIGAQMMSTLSPPQIILISECLMVTAFFVGMIGLRQMPPIELRKFIKERYNKISTEVIPVENGKMEITENPVKKKESIFATMFGLLKETIQTFIKKRPGNERAYIYCAGFVLFMSTVTEIGLRIFIFTLYVQRSPLYWTEKMIGYHKSAQGIMTVVGTLLGIVLCQRLFHLSDTFVIIIGTISHIVETFIMSFATETWLVYAASAAGGFSHVSGPCMQSFVAKHVPANEVGKAYTAFGIAAIFGVLISSAIYNPIYYATVAHFQGFVWLFASFMSCVTLCVVTWLHYDSSYKKQANNIGIVQKFIRSLFEPKEMKEENPGSRVAGPPEVPKEAWAEPAGQVGNGT